MVSEHLSTLRGVLPDAEFLTVDDESDDVAENPTETLLPAVADHPLAAIEDRVYLEIRPSETAVDPQAAIHAMEHLQQLLREHQQTGLTNKVAGTTRRPMVEWLIVSTGGPDPSLRYLVGANYDDLIPDLEGLCRQCFPDTYEFERVEWHPRRLQSHVDPEQTAAAGVHPDLDEPRAHPAITPSRPYVAGVQWYGDPDRRADWQTGLTRFDEMVGTSDGTRRRDRPREQRYESRQVPLATLIDTLSESPVPAVFSVVCRPYEDWTDRQDRYVTNLREGVVSTADKLWEFAVPRDQEERQRYEPPPSDQERIDRITARDPRRSLCLAVRAAVLTRSAPRVADQIARQLSDTLHTLSGPYHEIRGDVVTDDEFHTNLDEPPGSRLFTEICQCAGEHAVYRKPFPRLRRVTPRSPGIVVDPTELPGFCVVDGAGLTTRGRRSLATRPTERTGLPLPPPGQLDPYDPPGQLLCMPLTDDRRPLGDPLCLPPGLQTHHTVIAGDTGAGKSVLMTTAMLSNRNATDGPDILFAYKGGGMARNYLQTHYAVAGDLEDVRYFDLTEAMPAISVLDIEPLIEAGLPRPEAVQRKVGHFEEIVAGLYPENRYHEAADASRAVRNHLLALFDPVHGDEAVSIGELHFAIDMTLTQEEPPTTIDDDLQRYFDSLRERDREVFNRVLGAAVSRVQEVATDGRVAPLFGTPETRPPAAIRDPAGQETTAGPQERETATAPEPDGAVDGGATVADTAADAHATGEPTPHGPPELDFADLIDEDTTIVVDFGGIEPRAKAAITLALLSDLWTALKARAERATPSGSEGAALPQVNLYLDDAKDIANTELMDTLLAQGREFGLALTIGLQFPSQLRTAAPDTSTYRELLNETGTWLVGNVSVDDKLARVFATDELPREQVARRLARLQRGEWLVQPAAPYNEPLPRPFVAESLPAPRGHPARPEPLTDVEQAGFQQALADCRARTVRNHAVRHADRQASTTADDVDMDAITTAEGETPAVSAAAMMGAGDTDGDREAAETDRDQRQFHTTGLLPHTERLPGCVEYDQSRQAIQCPRCESDYDATIEGMADAIECCHSLEQVDRDDIPVCSFNLKRSPEEIAVSDWTISQLLFLQAVYNAQHLRYHPLEYDLVTDSMIRLQEYVGIDDGAIEALIDAGLLRHDTDQPHRLYSVTPDGRHCLNEGHREGVDYGHGQGDLEESSEHVLGVELARLYLEQTEAANPESPVVEVVPYYEVNDDHRLDLAGVDDAGEIVTTVEVERINNDLQRAAVEDYDKMAACDPDEAVWVVMTHAAARRIVDALYDPVEGEPRVEKTYAESTPVQQFQFDRPGLTRMRTVTQLRRTVDLEQRYEV